MNGIEAWKSKCQCKSEALVKAENRIKSMAVEIARKDEIELDLLNAERTIDDLRKQLAEANKETHSIDCVYRKKYYVLVGKIRQFNKYISEDVEHGNISPFIVKRFEKKFARVLK